MSRCSQCQATVAPTARFCQACGTSLTESPTLTSPPVRWAPSPAADLPRAPGTILAARYRIVGLLGRGGMGEVYRADDLKLGQPVALKFLPAAVATDPATLARFHGEVRVARQVSHANVCRIYDIGETEGEPFISSTARSSRHFGSVISAVHPVLAWRFGERLLPISGLPAEDAIDAASAIGALSSVLIVAIQSGLFIMFLFVLLTMLLRRRVFAVVAFFGVMYAFFLLLFEHRTPSGIVFAVIPATLAAIFATRFGLLTAVAFHVFLFLQEFYPTTLELSAWYAPATMVAFACTVGLAFYGLYVCLGGRPFAGFAALGDEFENGRSPV